MITDAATGEYETIQVMWVTANGRAASAELRTDPDGQLPGLQMLVGSGEVKAVPLGPDLVMWVSDDGIPGPVNLVVDHVCVFPGARMLVEDTYGAVVFTGDRDDQGQLMALSAQWRGVVERASRTVQSGCICTVSAAATRREKRTPDYFCPVHRFRDQRASR